MFFNRKEGVTTVLLTKVQKDGRIHHVEIAKTALIAFYLLDFITIKINVTYFGKWFQSFEDWLSLQW